MLKDYEIEVLRRLRDNEIIENTYFSIEKVARIINWDDIAKGYKVKKKFKNVLGKLNRKGYVDDHGKSLQVASLSKLGRNYLLALEEE